jgi:hypothetical protein
MVMRPSSHAPDREVIGLLTVPRVLASLAAQNLR